MDYNEFRKLIINDDKNAICFWWFNVDIDISWDINAERFFPVTASSDKSMIYGMEQILLMLAAPNDYVIFRHQPSTIVLDSIYSLGKALPNILEVSEKDNEKSISELIISDQDIISLMKITTPDKETYLVPYAVTSFEEEIAKLTGAHLIGPKYNLACWINNKINARYIAKELNFQITKGCECHTYDELISGIEMLCSNEADINIVLKDSYGSSGKGLFRIKSNEDIRLIEHQAKKKLKKNESFNVILEKWYDVKYNINYQVYITENNNSTLISASYQTIVNGIYTGSRIDKRSKDELSIIIGSSFKSISHYLYNIGYRGLCNIDSIILTDGTLIPIIDINGRLSLSTYISCLPFGNDRSLTSCYFDISNRISPEIMFSCLDNYHLAYDSESQTGVAIYSFSCGEKKNRVFFLVVNRCNNDDVSAEYSVDNIVRLIEKIEREG